MNKILAAGVVVALVLSVAGIFAGGETVVMEVPTQDSLGGATNFDSLILEDNCLEMYATSTETRLNLSFQSTASTTGATGDRFVASYAYGACN